MLTQVWRELIENEPKLVGGTLQHFEAGRGLFYGPIASISIQNDILVIATEWAAFVRIDHKGRPTAAPTLMDADADSFSYILSEPYISTPLRVEGRIYFTCYMGRVLLSLQGVRPLQRPEGPT